MLHFKGIVPILESMPDYSSAIKFIYGFCVHMTDEDFKYLQDFFTIYTKIDGGAIDIYMDPKFTRSKASETWKLNGLYHNNNGPAKRSFYYDMTIEREEYHVKGAKIKEYDYGYYGNSISLKFYVNGKLHRDNEPAVLKYKLPQMDLVDQEWWDNGDCMRINNKDYTEFVKRLRSARNEK